MLPNDDKVKTRLVSWIDIIKNNSNNKSPQTIKSIINFYISCLSSLNLCLDNWDINTLKIGQVVVEHICKSKRNYTWLELFVTKILNIEFKYKKDFLNNGNDKANWVEYYSGDKHIVPAKELDLIYDQSHKSNVFDQLMFLMFITTGMRVGGL